MLFDGLPLTQTSVTIISEPSRNPKLSLLYSRARLQMKEQSDCCNHIVSTFEFNSHFFGKLTYLNYLWSDSSCLPIGLELVDQAFPFCAMHYDYLNFSMRIHGDFPKLDDSIDSNHFEIPSWSYRMMRLYYNLVMHDGGNVEWYGFC